jgi:hypothetical protein
MAAQPVPWLARILEWVGAVLELNEGTEHLELVFVDGRLQRLRLRQRWLGPDVLQPFDEVAARFAPRLVTVDAPAEAC